MRCTSPPARTGWAMRSRDWHPPVPVNVIAWQPSSVESLSAGSGGVQYISRIVSDLDMAIPPTLEVSVRDRILLPGDDKPYEVVAIEDANHGFHGWTPGTILKLNRTTG